MLEDSKKYLAVEERTERPARLEEMLEISRKLSGDFPFVRCDYYIVNQKLYFGEMTFTPACGLYTAHTRIKGKEMTDYLNVP